MTINKVIYGGRTLIDLTGDTVTADKILSGFTAHDRGDCLKTRIVERSAAIRLPHPQWGV